MDTIVKKNFFRLNQNHKSLQPNLRLSFYFLLLLSSLRPFVKNHSIIYIRQEAAKILFYWEIITKILNLLDCDFSKMGIFARNTVRNPIVFRATTTSIEKNTPKKAKHTSKPLIVQGRGSVLGWSR